MEEPAYIIFERSLTSLPYTYLYMKNVLGMKYHVSVCISGIGDELCSFVDRGALMDTAPARAKEMLGTAK